MTDHTSETEGMPGAQEHEADVLSLLKSGQLGDRVKVLLIIGPAGVGKTNIMKLLTSANIPVGNQLQGTTQPTGLLTSLDGQLYVFIDTPGFGQPGVSRSTIESRIHGMLGYFTRTLGGVHGFIFVQNARETRPTIGTRDGIKFLKDLGADRIRERVTFVSTHWDVVAPIERDECEGREREHIRGQWRNFRVGEEGGARLFHSGVSCDKSTEAQKDSAKTDFLTGVLTFYKGKATRYLVMPFGELPVLDQVFTVIGYAGAIAGGLAAIGIAALHIAYGAVEVVFTVTISQ